jgi:hypothetical protein
MELSSDYRGRQRRDFQSPFDSVIRAGQKVSATRKAKPGG